MFRNAIVLIFSVNILSGYYFLDKKKKINIVENQFSVNFPILSKNLKR